MRKLKEVKHEDVYDVFCDKCGREYDEDMQENGDGDEFIHCPICGRDLCDRCYGRTLRIPSLDMVYNKEICADCRKLIDEPGMKSETNVLYQKYITDNQILELQISELRRCGEILKKKSDATRKLIYQKYVDEARKKLNNKNSNNS